MLSSGAKIIARRVFCPSSNLLTQSNRSVNDPPTNSLAVVPYNNGAVGTTHLSYFNQFNYHQKQPQASSGVKDSEESHNGPESEPNDDKKQEKKRPRQDRSGMLYFLPLSAVQNTLGVCWDGRSGTDLRPQLLRAS